MAVAFGRGKQRLGGISVEQTAERKEAALPEPAGRCSTADRA